MFCVESAPLPNNAGVSEKSTGGKVKFGGVTSGLPLASKVTRVLVEPLTLVAPAFGVFKLTSWPSKVAYISHSFGERFTKYIFTMCDSPNESYTVVDVDEWYVDGEAGSKFDAPGA